MTFVTRRPYITAAMTSKLPKQTDRGILPTYGALPLTHPLSHSSPPPPTPRLITQAPTDGESFAIPNPYASPQHCPTAVSLPIYLRPPASSYCAAFAQRSRRANRAQCALGARYKVALQLTQALLTTIHSLVHLRALFCLWPLAGRSLQWRRVSLSLQQSTHSLSLTTYLHTHCGIFLGAEQSPRTRNPRPRPTAPQPANQPDKSPAPPPNPGLGVASNKRLTGTEKLPPCVAATPQRPWLAWCAADWIHALRGRWGSVAGSGRSW
ncbi:uncharacterized protein J3D65DRAFT_684587 [Phyllosticta citribraziliensis]|uniref:Uncharacterized protein n=1 Tax=Phyllosticta citribraziliensis TaxID=989973 RepID=A0ABR1LCX7_9PEZI